jgi:hypothetical protein
MIRETMGLAKVNVREEVALLEDVRTNKEKMTKIRFLDLFFRSYLGLEGLMDLKEKMQEMTATDGALRARWRY